MVATTIWDWLIALPATIWGSLLAGLLTLFGVVVGQFAIYYRERQRKREEIDTLRSALITELRTIDDWLEIVLYAAHDIERLEKNNYRFSQGEWEDIFEKNELQAKVGLLLTALERMSIPRDVYESNTNRIGELDPNTVQAVISAYRSLDSLKQTLQELGNRIGVADLLLESDTEWSDGGIFLQTKYTKNEVLTATSRQKEALRQLGDDMTEDDLRAMLVVFTKESPQSEEQKELKNALNRYIEEHDLSPEEISKGDHPLAQEDSS